MELQVEKGNEFIRLLKGSVNNQGCEDKKDELMEDEDVGDEQQKPLHFLEYFDDTNEDSDQMSSGRIKFILTLVFFLHKFFY